MISNDEISNNFSLLAKLMDIHGENSFKAKSYAAAAFSVDKVLTPLSEMPQNAIFSIKGIGESAGNRIIEMLQTGKLQILEDIIQNTPPGILEMLKIKGIGPKKIATIWKELEIETLGELLYACNENRLTLYKGFGEKTQQNIKESIEFYMGTMGRYLYQQVESFSKELEKILTTSLPFTFQLTGEMRRQMEIIDSIDWVTNANSESLKAFMNSISFQLKEENESKLSFKNEQNITVQFWLANQDNFQSVLFETSCSEEFLNEWSHSTQWDKSAVYPMEDAIFSTYNCCPIPPCQRESASIINLAKQNIIPSTINVEDIAGIIHSHSTWSDGGNSLAEMAKSAIEKGMQYLVISDHSKSAFYANGLSIERVADQHKEIDQLNQQLAPFKIFKSIESDILNDGSLDYPDEILSSFDLIIASVHSNLKMNAEKANARLLKAIENKYTSILGHMTGRLLLSRAGYPINHELIIDACVANNVVIELNAHPRRLDIDWRWIKKALDKNVLISINPDAHTIDGYEDCKYGVLVAQKAGLSKNQNLSSFNVTQFEQFVQIQQNKRS
ncbi:MAG TPA: helix-hairpin-helix domain-containing protein [Sediminibacterium sp.]|uniref:DNA polymerase/3'-5' exonuclease PolX n=1 Tax=Sediminibacterium sp. TaxID=1917865 RepID=UPI0008C2F65D|nr:DNA polymerase/3'-5' exonuclease PolX [Sediminibacterium sp.]OHC85110.1 MAG: histidinol-phosphatase [Sphingobacteriia bacterium RIFOXYC2_FULL_35_18]OHC87158.1 MAG: histidinol-phosphatase [Sphingobacteriia bacterium RIFOXYD2_FULL_35_12]HLD52214.1 helix-hairpin-helix domain-containing protein [Sediminibacterium sp.]